MNFTHEEKQRAFATYRSIFSAENAGKIKKKQIKEILTSHHQSAGPALTEVELDRTAVLIRRLRGKRVFSSVDRAMKMFPEMFTPPPTRAEARQASEASASRKELEMLDAVDGAHDAAESPDAVPDKFMDSMQSNDAAAEETFDDTRPSSEGEFASGPNVTKQLSLFPTYLPYETQHLLLKGVQELLERCCFDFMSQWFPEEMQNRGWESSNAVELTKWTHLIPKWQKKIPVQALEMTIDGTLRQICVQVNQIRHAAVHRLPLSANTLQSQLQAAIKLTSTLKDEPRTAALTKIAENFGKSVKELEVEKMLIETNFDREMASIKDQRRKLDEAEVKLLKSARQRDSEGKAMTGRNLRAGTQQILSGLNDVDHEADPDSDSKLSKKDVHAASYWSSLLVLRKGLEALGVKFL